VQLVTPVSEGARSDAHGGHAGDQTDQHSKARSLELTVEPPVAPPPTVGPVDAGATTARNSATVAIWTLLSRVTGLLRVVVIGAVLGPTYFANSFQSTNVVPNIVFSLIAGPVLTMVVVPGLMSALHTDGGQRGREVFARVSGWLLLVGCGFVALLAASPVVAWTLTWGIPTAAERSHGLWLTTLLVVLLAPQLLGYCLVHLGISAQRAHGKFALSAAAPAIENVILIAVLLAAGLIYGPGLDIAHVPISLVITLGAGSTIAVAIHAAVQLFGAARVGLLAWPSLRWRDDAQAVAVTRRLSRSVGVAALPSGAMYVLFALADAVPGGVFVVQMCYAVLYALSYLSSRAVSMASLPELADAARAGDLGQFGVIWRRGLAFALIAGLPLMILLGILGQPTATVLANGALEHAAVVGPLGICLAVVAVAQLVTGLADLGNQALYAREQDRVPRLASRVTLAVTLGSRHRHRQAPSPTAAGRTSPGSAPDGWCRCGSCCPPTRPRPAPARTRPAHRSRGPRAPPHSPTSAARADHAPRPEPTRTPSTSSTLKINHCVSDHVTVDDNISAGAQDSKTSPQTQVQARSAQPTITEELGNPSTVA
jgi:peptidoglycan biosynthesis protein MviN/MurJ (putative lipid II flippase)